MTALERKVDEIEQKKKEYERKEQLEQAVGQADERLQRHNDRMDDLADKTNELAHRNGVVTDVFGREERHSVDTARKKIRKVTTTTQQDVLDLLSDERLGQESQVVKDALDGTDTAIDDSKNRLDDIKEEWINSVETAERVARIIGKSREFDEVSSNIKKFVQTDMWRVRQNRVSRLQNEWSSNEARWSEVGIDWNEFQKEHGLSGETIGVLRTLSEDDNVNLSTASLGTVGELFDVAALRQNIELTI
jgi:hypothetical protein